MKCSLGVGCEDAGVCYASAMGDSSKCGKMTDTRDSFEKVIAELRNYAQAIRTSPTCSCNECDLCAWIAIDPDTFADRLTALQAGAGDAQDAERYRFLRQRGNAIVYAKMPEAWGYKDSPSGHVRYDTPEQLDAAIDNAIATQGHDLGVV